MATVKVSKPIKSEDQMTQTLESMTAAGQQQVRENMDRTLAAMSEFGAFGKENMEAWIASATVSAKGFEAMSGRAGAFYKQSMENHVAAAKSIMGAKSVQEAVERQTEYAQTAFARYMAEMNQLSDMWSGLAKDALKPLNERLSAMQTLMQSAHTR
jgi:phasin family protein